MKETEEQWTNILQMAEDTLKEAEVQYSLNRETDAFRIQAGNTKAWVEDLQRQAQAKGTGIQGSPAQIEDRLSTAQVQQGLKNYQHAV